MTYEEFKTAEKEGWEARAAAYNDYTGRVTSQAIARLLALAEIAPEQRILDLCCGTGRAAGAASALGARAEGIDISPAMVAAASAAFPNVSFEVGDAENIPRDNRTYDAVICSFGLMHVASPQGMLQEIGRVLRPGGCVALSHWVGPPESPLFKIVFGAMQRLADMSVVPPSPPPFALSSKEAMEDAFTQTGFTNVVVEQLSLVFTAPEGKFTEYFRNFAARAAVILDRQSKDVLNAIHAAWDEQLEGFLADGEYRIPMPALAVAATKNP